MGNTSITWAERIVEGDAFPPALGPLERGPLAEIRPGALFPRGFMWTECFGRSVLEDRHPECGGGPGKCRICGDETERTCQIAEDIGIRIHCAIADLKKPEGGWPEGAIEQIIAAVKYAANY